MRGRAVDGLGQTTLARADLPRGDRCVVALRHGGNANCGVSEDNQCDVQQESRIQAQGIDTQHIVIKEHLY